MFLLINYKGILLMNSFLMFLLYVVSLTTFLNRKKGVGEKILPLKWGLYCLFIKPF